MPLLKPPIGTQEIALGKSRVFLLWRDQLPADATMVAQLPASVVAEAGRMQAPMRRQEYLGARWLLRHLLNNEHAVVRGAAGIPAWPIGILGSISHKAGHVCVTLDSTGELLGIGIDLESIAKFNPGIAQKICNAAEQQRLGLVAEQNQTETKALFALAFAFKEAIYKTYYPTGHIQFWFEDAEIIGLDQGLGKIHAVIKKDVSPHAKPGHMVTGHFCWLENDGEQYVLVLVEERRG